MSRFTVMLATALLSGLPAQAAPQVPLRVILAGDSTMAEGSGYGSALCARFAPEVSCVNLAKRGRGSASFRQDGHWDEVLKMLRQDPAGQTYVLVQFGHNDQPGKGVHSTDLVHQFPANMARYAREVQDLGGVPVLVTPLTRRGFKGPYVKDDLGPWAEATRRTAAAGHVALVDLNRLSADIVQAMGQAEADTLAPEPPGQPNFDRTHLGPKGAEVFSAIVATELIRNIPSLRPFIKSQSR